MNRSTTGWADFVIYLIGALIFWGMILSVADINKEFRAELEEQKRISKIEFDEEIRKNGLYCERIGGDVYKMYDCLYNERFYSLTPSEVGELEKAYFIINKKGPN